MKQVDKEYGSGEDQRAFFADDNTFVKQYHAGYDKKLVKQEFEKSLRIHEILKKHDEISFPKPTGMSLDERSIRYERAEHEGNLRQRINEGSEDLARPFYLAGKALALVHAGLNGKKISSLREEIELYGDITPNNVLLCKNAIVLLDVGPCGETDCKVEYHGPAAKDIAKFVRASVNQGTFSRFFSHRKHSLAHLFMQGYADHSSCDFDLEAVYEQLVEAERPGTLCYPVSKWFVVKRRLRQALNAWRFSARRRLIKGFLKKEYEYRDDYDKKGKAKNYDSQYDKPDHFYGFLWHKREVPIVTRFIGKKGSHLDFACGSGRTIIAFEKLFEHSMGVDVSKKMIELARKRTKSKIILGDITTDLGCVDEGYDCITAFRFFLNAHTLLRHQAMFSLSRLLKDDGVLVFNVHGNLWSNYLPVAVLSKLTGRPRRSMSVKQIKRLLALNNLQIEHYEGAGLLPNFFRKILGDRRYLAFDAWAGKTWLRYFCFDLVVFAKKRYSLE